MKRKMGTKVFSSVMALVLTVGLSPGLALATSGQGNAPEVSMDLSVGSQDTALQTQEALADGTYTVAGLSTAVLNMYHFDADAARVVVKGDNAWLITSPSDASTLNRFDGMAYGPQSKILDTNDETNHTLVAGTPVAKVVDTTDDGVVQSRTYVLPVSKEVLEAGGDIYYMIKYRAEYSATHDGDWYKASGGDYYLTGYTLAKESDSTALPGDEEPTRYVVGVKIIKTADGKDYTMFVPTYSGVSNKALIEVDSENNATINYYIPRNTYKAIWLGHCDTLNTAPTDDQLASENYVAGTAATIGGTSSYTFAYGFDVASLGKTEEFTTVSRSSGKFNASQLAFVFDENMVTMAAFEVIGAIDALPAAEDVTVRSEDAIKAARAAYDALTEAQKAEVTNLEKLTAAEAAFAALPPVSDEAKAVIAACDTLAQSPVDITDEAKATIAKAREDFNALSTQQKAYVDDATYSKLVRAEACVQFATVEGISEGWLLDVGVDTASGPFVAATISPRQGNAYLYLYSETSQFTGADKVEGTVSKSSQTLAGDKSILKGLWQIGTDEGQGRTFTIALTGANGKSDNIAVKVPAVYGPMTEGAYSVVALQSPESKMRKFENVTVTSAKAAGAEEGAEPTLTATFTMPNTSYGKIYLGTATAAAAATDGFIEPVGTAASSGTTGEGNVYTIPIESMYQPITISYYATKSGSWTQETVEFVVDEQTQAAVEAIAALNLNTYFNVTADQRDLVEAASALYEPLDANQKALMDNSNYPTLKKVVAMFAIADEAAAMIEALPAADAMTAADVPAVREAKAAFDGMGSSDIIKEALGKKADGTYNTLQNSQIEKLVSQDLRDKLAADVTKANELDQAAAADVAAMIEALPAPGSVTDADKAAIVAARTAYNALSAVQKTYVPAETYAKLLAVEATVNATFELKPYNEELMFKVVNAYVDRVGNDAFLVFALSGTGYKYVYAGTQAEALANTEAIAAAYPNNETAGNLVRYAEAEVECSYATARDGDKDEGVQTKYQFRVPITDEDALAAVMAGTGSFRVPITAVSDTKANAALAGTGTWEQALFARQAVVNLDDGVATTGNYSEVIPAKVSSSIATMGVAKAGEILTIGTPTANEFTCQPTFTSTDGNYDLAFIGTAEAAASAVAADVIVPDDGGVFTIPLHNGLGKDPQINTETWEATVCFHVPVGLMFAEADQWVERTLTVNPETGTVAIAGAELTPVTSIDGATVALVNPAAMPVYNGQPKEPAVTVTLGDVVLNAETDYDVAYANNINAGTATVTVTGKGLYVGTASTTFEIVKAATTVKLANQSKVYNGKAQAYSGKVTKTGSTGKITYKYYSNKACTKAVKAANVKNAGTYYVTATVAQDANYAGATSLPAKLTITKAASTLKVVPAKATQTAKYGKTTTIKAAKAFKVKKNVSKGKVSYAKKSDNAKIAVSKTGDVAVKKGLKKGTYTVKVNATSAATANYKAAACKNITFKVRVV